MRSSAQRKLTYSSQSHCTSTLLFRSAKNRQIVLLIFSKSHILIFFIDYSLSFSMFKNVPVSSAPYIHQIPPFPPVPDLYLMDWVIFIPFLNRRSHPSDQITDIFLLAGQFICIFNLVYIIIGNFQRRFRLGNL